MTSWARCASLMGAQGQGLVLALNDPRSSQLRAGVARLTLADAGATCAP